MPSRDLVVLITQGADHELSSVAFTIANGGMTAGLSVSAFLTSAAVDLVRKRAIDGTVVPPLDANAACLPPERARTNSRRPGSSRKHRTSPPPTKPVAPVTKVVGY